MTQRLCQISLSLTIFSLLGLVACRSAAVSLNYTVKDLGTLSGTDSYAEAINNLGQVVGYSKVTGNTATSKPQTTPFQTSQASSKIKPDPNFTGPFSTKGETPKIIGFDDSPGRSNPTKKEVLNYSLKAVNFLRSRTGLRPYKLDPKLTKIAEEALKANRGHGYFINNCMNAAYGYGRKCKAGWAQENIGGASGTDRTWKDGIRVPLCSMMDGEPKGVGHRQNIESKEWTRIGIAATCNDNGCFWHHEFGR
jgi:probable HAF family extracellular repeat protein